MDGADVGPDLGSVVYRLPSFPEAGWAVYRLPSFACIRAPTEKLTPSLLIVFIETVSRLFVYSLIIVNIVYLLDVRIIYQAQDFTVLLEWISLTFLSCYEHKS